MRIRHGLYIMCAFIILLISTQCTEFIEVKPPQTSLVKETVFSSDATADAAVTDVYYQLQSSIFASGGIYSITYLATLLSDEQKNFYSSASAAGIEFQQFNDNAVLPNNSIIMYVWSDLYNVIYKCNAILEGLNTTSSLTPTIKLQLEGEARFVRAFCYFYLVNLWGDVPYVTTTNYEINRDIKRSLQSEILLSLEEELISASEKLPPDFERYRSERVRATRWAAKTLLARVYLYEKKWSDAEIIAGEVISTQSLFKLIQPEEVFQTNSNEAILQLWSPLRPKEYGTFLFSRNPTFGALEKNFAENFEQEDARRAMWVDLAPSGYYRVRKYSDPSSSPAKQYSTVFRLAELFLIRAESRFQQKNFEGGVNDLNVIRSRAGLPELTLVNETNALNYVMIERKSEMFAEWGHRWFDLKRTGKAEDFLAPIKTGFKPSSLLLPLPQQEIRNNPAILPQNPGY